MLNTFISLALLFAAVLLIRRRELYRAPVPERKTAITAVGTGTVLLLPAAGEVSSYE